IGPFIFGVNPFELIGTKLVELLTKVNNGKIDDHEAEYGYSFLEISVGIYRNTTSRNVEEMISEAKKNW
ncbi:MAG TPA: hypothetical protein VF941_14885, partial [Clostridia bacterium]